MIFLTSVSLFYIFFPLAIPDYSVIPDYVYDSIVTLQIETVPGIVQLATGVAVSPNHVITLALFPRNSTPAICIDETAFFPDTVIFCFEIATGPVLLEYSEVLFENFRLPSDYLPEIGEEIILLGQGIGGISRSKGTVTSQMNDGTLIISSPPREGLMGAVAFNQSGDFIGLIAGVISTQSNQFEQANADRLALLPSQIWALWAQMSIFEQDYAGLSFGVTATSYASGFFNNSPSGVLLVAIDRDGKAWEAGLRPGDIVVAVDDMTIYHPVTLRGLVITSDEEIKLTVCRRDRYRDIFVSPMN